MTGVSKKIRTATADAGAHTDEILAFRRLHQRNELQQMRAKGVI